MTHNVSTNMIVFRLSCVVDKGVFAVNHLDQEDILATAGPNDARQAS